jgi:hypothetical protein
MNTLAKQIHNITPNDVRLTFEDGGSVTLSMRSAEFFQEAFQAEAEGPEGRIYRLVSDGTDDPPVAGRERADGEGWETAGVVEGVDRAGG